MHQGSLQRASLAAALIAALASGCATEIQRMPVTLTAARPGMEGTHTVERAVPVRSTSGYERPIPAGSKWHNVGSIPQGDVYRRSDDVYVVEGAHIHEAFIVVRDNQVIGFYLPVEKSFSPTASAAPITFKRENA